MIDFSLYKSVICLGGTLPDSSFFQNINVPIIAVDGAANALSDMSIKYDMIIGDLDSARPELIAAASNKIHLPSQELSDFQKTMQYVAELGLCPTIILGIGGGHVDHILHNINIFSALDCLFFAPPIIGKMIRASKQEQFSLPYMSKTSLLAMPNAVVTTTGLKWDLDRQVLSFPGMNSCFNRVAKDEITISVEAGQILMMIYLEDIVDHGTN